MTMAQSNESSGICGASLRSPTIVASGLPSSAIRMSHARDVAAEPVRVVGRGDLENSSADVVGVATDETLDVDPVDRRAALEAPVGVDRGRAPELSELRWATAPALDHGRAKRPEPATKRCRHDSPPTRGQNVLFAGSQGRDDSAVGSIVVLSPHSDDGVLSLGATMARWARFGWHVELLTVFALDPASNTPTGGWDRRAGFLTEGDAARARRDEDRVACSILGVTPRWLPFGSVDFDRHGDDAEVWDAVGGVVDGASVVLVPGSPLTHPDHAWLNRLVFERSASFPVARYAEQPYTFKARGAPFDRGRREPA